VPDGRGVSYDCRPLAYGGAATVDDSLCLYHTKRLA
jgi:hypothetical protein